MLTSCLNQHLPTSKNLLVKSLDCPCSYKRTVTMSSIDQENKTGAQTHPLEQHDSELSNDDDLFLCEITNNLNDTSEKEEAFNENTANDELYHTPLEYVPSEEKSKTIQKRTDVPSKQRQRIKKEIENVFESENFYPPTRINATS